MRILGIALLLLLVLLGLLAWMMGQPAASGTIYTPSRLSGASGKSSALLADAWNSRLWRPTERLTRGVPWRGLDGSVADLPDGPLSGSAVHVRSFYTAIPTNFDQRPT